MMERRSKIGLFLTLLAAVLVLAASAFWMDLRIARGSTRSESQTQAYSAGVPAGEPKPAINQLTVYVEEPGYLMGSVRQGVVKGIQDTHGIQDLRVVDEMPQTVDGPVLYVDATPEQFFWLPFFTRADFDVRAVYSSDGELGWMDDQAVVLEESPLVRMRSDFDVVDTSFGLMTLRGQSRYLGRQIASELIKAIDNHLY
jgi:HAMP domain-containing protein